MVYLSPIILLLELNLIQTVPQRYDCASHGRAHDEDFNIGDAMNTLYYQVIFLVVEARTV